MYRTAGELRETAEQIWQAGVDAVRPEKLIRNAVRVNGSSLEVGEASIDLGSVGRIAVVGAGKAGAGMAAALQDVLAEELLAEKRVTGWVNVPDDCVLALAPIHLHGARPAGVNEPTPAGVVGAEEILRLVGSLAAEDLCICLISGGGSALLPAPVEGISLEDKLAVTRHLSGAGANIQQLNTVRKQLSRIKGGRLAAACGAGRLIALIISDVIGDPLDVIASGPTVADPATANDALAVLKQFQSAGHVPAGVFEYLERADSIKTPASHCEVTNLVIGNNATAVDAAGAEAVRQGLNPAIMAATELEGEAEGVGRHLAAMALRMRDQPGPNCLIPGGEPVVRLAPPERRGDGGRNQQLVLAACQELFDDGAAGIALLSGGTDGEDGPTDAAGAVLDADVIAAARRRGLSPGDFLERNDAYHFFEPLGGLLKTGPTGTNVCDLRVVVVSKG